MPRVAGINIPDRKHIVISLQSIFGIGKTIAKQICEKVGVDPTKKAIDIDNDTLEKIRGIIDSDYQVEGDLRREEAANIKRLKDLRTYRGSRHRRRLPMRKRTKTNAKTCKRGKRHKSAEAG